MDNITAREISLKYAAHMPRNAGVLLLRAPRSSQKLSRIIFNRRTPANEIRGASASARGEGGLLSYLFALTYDCAIRKIVQYLYCVCTHTRRFRRKQAASRRIKKYKIQVKVPNKSNGCWIRMWRLTKKKILPYIINIPRMYLCPKSHWENRYKNVCTFMCWMI